MYPLLRGVRFPEKPEINMIKVFGHKGPDTDATGSAIVWAWYLDAIQKKVAEPFVLGKPNSEALFVLDRWRLPCPEILEKVGSNDDVVIVDTNNPAELPEGINSANVLSVIDHHLIAGGLRTRQPIEFTVRPVAATATVIAGLMGEHIGNAPDPIKGVMLSCILSDTLEFRSPTTTKEDETLARQLANDLGVNITEYANELFAAKSDVSHLSDAELLRLDSKIYEFLGRRLRVTVIETTDPLAVLSRKEAMIDCTEQVAREDGVDQILVFVIDILNECAELLLPNRTVCEISLRAFGVEPEKNANTLFLPGIMSRKKQIVPALQR